MEPASGRYRKREMHVLHPRDDNVYAIFLKWQGDEFHLKSVKPVTGSKITMLGVPGDLKWKWDESTRTHYCLSERKGQTHFMQLCMGIQNKN